MGEERSSRSTRTFPTSSTCIGCGNCLVNCPTYSAVGNAFGEDGMLGGRGVALASLQKGVKEGIEDGLFLCTTCGLCGQACPVEIDAGKRLKDLRKASLASPEISSQLDEITLLQSTIDQYGTPYGQMDRAEFPVPQKKSSVVLYIGCVGRTQRLNLPEMRSGSFSGWVSISP